MGTTFASAVTETFRSLQYRNFRLWFTGQSISMVGFFAQTMALAILVLELTDSSAVLGAVMALYFIPNFIVGPWAGVISDRVDKRRLLLISQSTMMTCALGLGVITLAGWATLSWVVVLAGLTGVAFAFDQPARRTIVTELVDTDAAANAVGLNGALAQGAKLVGPAVAGLLIGTVGVGWCFVLNGISSLAVLAALIRMDKTAIQRAAPVRRDTGQIVEGFRYLWADRSARLLLSMLGIVTCVGLNWSVLLPLMAMRDLGGSSNTLALLMGTMSAGSLAGVLWLARRGQVAESELAMTCTVFGVASLMLAGAPTVGFASIVAFVAGATSMALFNGCAISIQLGAEPEMRGRVMAVFGMVVLGGHALGSPTSGWIAQVMGARSALAVGAIASLVIGLWVASALRRASLKPAGGDRYVPATAVLEAP